MDHNLKIACHRCRTCRTERSHESAEGRVQLITVLEKSDHVGGKCSSPSYHGRRYEMGAIMGVPSYYAVHDAEEFGGVTHDWTGTDEKVQEQGRKDH
jgi:hypothetical protein